MSDYSDILNRKKTSDNLGDAFSRQADSMRPLNVGQRREQALLRGLGVGLNNNDEREAKLAELEEQYKQIDGLNRQLQQTAGKNQLKEQKIKSFIMDQDSNLKLASDLIVKGKYDQLDILAPSIVKAYTEHTGTSLGEFLFSKNGHFSFRQPDGKIDTMEAKTLFNPIMNYIPVENRGNYKGFATSYQAEELDAIVEARRLKNEAAESQIESNYANSALHRSQAEKIRQETNNPKNSKELQYVSKQIADSNIKYLDEYKKVGTNKRVIAAYKKINELMSKENKSYWNREGSGFISTMQRWVNPSMTDSNVTQARIALEKLPIWNEFKEIFGAKASDQDLKAFLSTMPDLDKPYKANKTAIEGRIEDLENTNYEIEDTIAILERENYLKHHTHTSVRRELDELKSKRRAQFEKNKLKVSGKVKLQLKDGSVKIYDKKMDNKAIGELLNNNLADEIQ